MGVHETNVEFKPNDVAMTLSISEVAHGASGFLLERDFSDKVTGSSREDTLNGWAFTIIREVSVDGPRHNVVDPMPEWIGILNLRTPGWRGSKVATLPLS